MLSTEDMQRVANDASLAIDRLTSIMIVANEGRLHERYLAEKIETAESCVKFIKRLSEAYNG